MEALAGVADSLKEGLNVLDALLVHIIEETLQLLDRTIHLVLHLNFHAYQLIYQGIQVAWHLLSYMPDCRLAGIPERFWVAQILFVQVLLFAFHTLRALKYVFLRWLLLF